MSLPISIGDLLKIYELTQKHSSKPEKINVWLDAVYKDLESFAKIWTGIITKGDVTSDSARRQLHRADEALALTQTGLATRLSAFYEAAEKVLFSQGPNDFNETFVFKFGSLLQLRSAARGVMVAEYEEDAELTAARRAKLKLYYNEMIKEVGQLQVLITTYKATSG
jgi:hypothetical protein